MSLREIARQAGVSVATVSRVVNDVDRNKVSDETRDRVLAIARSMRYRPNPQAVALVTGRPPNALGLYIPYNSHVFDSFYFTEIIRGAADAANSRGMSITLYVPSRDATSDVPRDVLIGHRAVAGLLLVGARIDDPVIAQCRDTGAPFALVNNSTPEDGVNSVDCDNVSGATAATRHLLDLGHRRIGFIAGPDDSSNARDRRRGYEVALRAAGVAVDASLIAPGRFEEDGGAAAMETLLCLADRPTAVFAANDMMALGALDALRDAGLRVPEDIALVGFDDIPTARYIAPRLTTVHQPIYDVGRRAAETVLAQALAPSDAPPAACHQMLDTRLVVRESCGACRPIPEAA
jgi:LacI family transcriptional regulator